MNFAGDFSIDHTYNAAGIYKVTVRVTDKNGDGLLQLVAVANGAKPGWGGFWQKHLISYNEGDCFMVADFVGASAAVYIVLAGAAASVVCFAA